MAPTVHIVDPLRIKLAQLIRTDDKNIFSVARIRYGTQADVDELNTELKRTPQCATNCIDLTPFSLLGRPLELLKTIATHLPRSMILVGHEDLFRDLCTLMPQSSVTLAYVAPNGMLKTIFMGRRRRLSQSRIKEMRNTTFSHCQLPRHCEELSDIECLRSVHSQCRLLKLLRQASAIARPDDFPDHMRTISGTKYLIMPNDMLVTRYLDLKKLVLHPDVILEFVYECVVALSRGFRRDVDWLGLIDGIAVPNNTALLLASLVAILLAKPLYAIDRLGPIPALPTQRGELAAVVANKKLVLFEEAIATGNEVDRSILYLDSCGASVERVICGFNLEAGRPLLLKEKSLRSLCFPAKAIRYEYRSAHSIRKAS